MKNDFVLENYLADCQSLINESLRRLIPATKTTPEKLHEAMYYSLLAEGKRVRPILCLAAAEACGGRREEVLPVACSLEIIHAFSLIHDDLPSMDNDDLRRGRPTNHRIFGEATAILAGDALLSQAFMILSGVGRGHASPSRVMEVIHDIAEATGSIGMVGGQVLDLHAEGTKLDEGHLRELHRLKTGRLICVSVMSGAKLVTDDSKILSCLKDYGESVGLAFQIADDILDVVGGKGWGKNTGSDVKKNKSTYPSVMGLEQSREEAEKACEQALASLSTLSDRAEPLRALARYIVSRNK